MEFEDMMEFFEFDIDSVKVMKSSKLALITIEEF